MIETLLILLLMFAAVALVFYAAKAIASSTGLPAPAIVIFGVILVILFVYYALARLGLLEKLG